MIDKEKGRRDNTNAALWALAAGIHDLVKVSGNVIPFLAHMDLFRNLDLTQIEEWAATCREKSRGRQEVIFMENDPADAFYIIKSGVVKIYRLSEDGREKILGIFGVGDFFGEMGMLDGSPRSAGAITLRESALLAINEADFRRLISSYPQVAFNISQVLSQRLRRANQQIEDLVFRNTRARIIRTLVGMVTERGLSDPGIDRVVLPLTHQDLAGLAGTSRETVTRVMVELEKRGVVERKRRSIVISCAAIGRVFDAEKVKS